MWKTTVVVIKMAGFYTVPFQKIAPKTAESSKESSTPLDSFKDVVKCLQSMILNFMRKEPELCEVFKKGENEELDKQLDEYLTYRKSNVFVLYSCHSFQYLPSLFFF